MVNDYIAQNTIMLLEKEKLIDKVKSRIKKQNVYRMISFFRRMWIWESYWTK